AYGLFSPDLFDKKTGKLTPEAVKLDDLCGKKDVHVDECGLSSGLSVARMQKQKATEELTAALKVITARSKKDGSTRTIEGYALACVREIEAVENRSLAVLDDGCHCFTTHAIIRGASGYRRSALRGSRDKLVELLNRKVVRRA
ncbi:MAG: hypothetical protein WCC40_06095, partial [Rhodomicrobium sp.]